MRRCKQCNVCCCFQDKEGLCSACSHEKNKPPTLYTIKPLEWKKEFDGCFIADFLGGDYYISLIEGKYRVHYRPTRGHITWWTDATSIEDGKAQAERHYMEQIGKCLVVYNG